jgi:hypothetical protein
VHECEGSESKTEVGEIEDDVFGEREKGGGEFSGFMRMLKRQM